MERAWLASLPFCVAIPWVVTQWLNPVDEITWWSAAVGVLAVMFAVPFWVKWKRSLNRLREWRNSQVNAKGDAPGAIEKP